MGVCGLDEVGRGALAGPLVAAAVTWGEGNNLLIEGLNDSKLLSVQKRRNIYEQIKKSEAKIAVEIISAQAINKYGIGWANKEIFRRLILKMEADRYVVDGNLKIKVRGKRGKIQSLVKADAQVKEVMAAAIIAKVTRDELMQELAREFEAYGWSSNVGYGTKFHVEALRKIGVSKHHRTIFVNTALRERVLME